MKNSATGFYSQKTTVIKNGNDKNIKKNSQIYNTNNEDLNLSNNNKL